MNRSHLSRILIASSLAAVVLGAAFISGCASMPDPAPAPSAQRVVVTAPYGGYQVPSAMPVSYSTTVINAGCVASAAPGGVAGCGPQPVTQVATISQLPPARNVAQAKPEPKHQPSAAKGKAAKAAPRTPSSDKCQRKPAQAKSCVP